jgi:chemotaxis family two-component system sensor kinase Cph1
MIRGEREGLFRVFINLIDNAIKYIGSGEDKRIEIRCDDLGEQWRFCVCDNGIGVPDNYQETIFAVFERVPEMDREGLEGTGVGLSIVKKIIEAHNGRIWVESEEGKGSFFYFTIPKNIC